MFRANAKVNLFLDVTARRPDGFHDILTVFQEIKLSDSLQVRRKRTAGLTLDCRPDIPGNILEKVWSVLERTRGPLPGVQAVLKKTLPLGAGLGGGSSDAACFLKALNRLLGLGLDGDGMERICAEIGSDAPFFIRGGCRTGHGRGEILEPLAHQMSLRFVVVHPGFPVSTAEAYAGLDPARFGLGREKFGRLKTALMERKLTGVAANLYNVFEPTVFSRHPELAEIVRRLKDEGALNALMSGSGSSVFGLFRDPFTAGRCVRRLKRLYPFTRTAEEKH